MLTVNRRMGTVVAVASCLALLMTMVVTNVPAQAAARHQPRPLPRIPSVPGRSLAATTPGASQTAARARRGSPPSSGLPRAGSLVVDLSSASPGRLSPSAVGSGELPISVGAPAGASQIGGAPAV